MADDTERIYIVHVNYKCGSEVGFATKDADKAAKKAAEIMDDVCPECKLRQGKPLSQDEIEMLLIGFNNESDHEVAKTN